MMKNKSLFTRLLENKKFMLLASFILAFVFWIISSDNISKTIEDIPLQTVLSESAEKEGLKVYSVNPETISVDISGKRLIVDALSESDFSASVDLFNVSKAGTDSYEVEVKTKSNMSFSMDGTKPLRVTVMVDKEVTKTVAVHKLFDYEPQEGYYISDDMPSTVTITGPQSIVNEVKSAYVSDEIEATDDLIAKKTLTVHLCDKSDPNDPDKKDIHSEYIKLSNESFVDVNFKFMEIRKEVPLALNLNHESVALPPECYSFDPPTLDVAGDESILFGENSIKSIIYNLETFENYSNENTSITIDVSEVLPEGVVCTNTDTVTLKLNLSFLSQKEFVTENIVTAGLNDNHSFHIPESFKIKVIGTAAALSDLDEKSFTVTYNFSDVIVNENSTVVEVPVDIKNNSGKNIGVCWVYRTANYEKVEILK